MRDVNEARSGFKYAVDRSLSFVDELVAEANNNYKNFIMMPKDNLSLVQFHRLKELNYLIVDTKDEFKISW